jgi:hypothetical protein
VVQDEQANFVQASTTVSGPLTPRDFARVAPMMVGFWNDFVAVQTSPTAAHFPLRVTSFQMLAGLPRRFSRVDVSAQDDTEGAVNVIHRLHISATPIGVWPVPIAFR